ncbi:CoA-binding protein [Polycladidibacter stylochi]|uniref:CoA-binding protein n=1 Tax=Polycladidibacter stylochi TaxID=1807766 RepID=UPI00082C64A6|nr:CoA-binding protein [Pseudovibrio stylochi]
MNHDNYPQNYTLDILGKVKSIALVGASANEARPSNKVMRFMQDKGYKVLPVNPGLAGQQLNGETVYASLQELPQKVDMIDIFRNAEAAALIIDEALVLEQKPDVIWMQLEIRHDEAAQKAEDAGLQVVMNRCPKIELS